MAPAGPIKTYLSEKTTDKKLSSLEKKLAFLKN